MRKPVKQQRNRGGKGWEKNSEKHERRGKKMDDKQPRKAKLEIK